MNNKKVPKYLEIVNWIKLQIAQGTLETGARLQSEKELGEYFSLSRQTVRQATSILENEGVLERRQGSGTYIALNRTPNRTSTKNIGIITTYLDDYLFPGIIKGIDGVLTQQGYSIQLSITYNKIENEMKILNVLLENGIDGLIIEPTKSALPLLNLDLYRQIQKKGISCIFINSYYEELAFPFVMMDDYACGRSAAEYLLGKNHKRFAGVFKFDDRQGHLRYAGCTSALKKKGILLHEQNLIWFTTEDLEFFCTKTFEQLLLQRVAGCSAVVCYNDKIAIYVIEVLRKHKYKVPEDISIISFDNSDLATRNPVGLTTFSHPKQDLGKMAAINLLKLMRMEKINTAVKFAPQLVERESIRCL